MHFKIFFIAASICCSALAQDRLLSILYFDPNWCPREDEVTALSRFMNIRRNGCCIREALVFTEYRSRPEVLAPWRHRISTENTFNSACTGHVMTEQEEQLEQTEKFTREQADSAEAIERNRLVTAEAANRERIASAEDSESARLAVIHAKQEKETARQRKEAMRRDAPKILRTLSHSQFCYSYGLAIREKTIPGIGSFPEFPALVTAEATRRGLFFDNRIIADANIRIGMTECQLYAARGYPDVQNRSVGKWGVHIQHVYRASGVNIYSENGTVTAWQD